jgi:molecular chaperone DnaK
MKDHPEIHVSRTLSRGKADERLFLSLEESIRSANIAKHQFYAVHDFIDRTVDVIHEINRIVDPETGEVQEEISSRASKKLDKAVKILESEESPWGTINYAKAMLGSCRSFMNPEKIHHLETALQRLEKSNREGSYEETIVLTKDLSSEMNKHPVALLFMEMERAYDYYREKNSPQAERILSHMEKMHASLEKSDFQKFSSLVKEIMPEIREVAELERSQILKVEKGIAK